MIAEVLVLGTVVGGIWALVASGFSLIFGVARILNFAHGVLFILGAYFTISLNSVLSNFFGKLSLVLSIFLSILLVGFIGLLIYWILLAPIKEYEIMIMLITLALALLVNELILLTFKDISISVPTLIPGKVEILGIPLTYTRIFALLSALSLLIALELFIRKTRIGKSILAVSQDKEAAMLIGINVDRIYSLSMFISAVFAAFGGILYAQIYAVNPETALRVLIYAFAIVILGGLGNVRGSIFAAFIIGYLQVLTSLTLGARWIEIVAMVIIILILIIRPKGLFGVET